MNNKKKILILSIILAVIVALVLVFFLTRKEKISIKELNELGIMADKKGETKNAVLFYIAAIEQAMKEKDTIMIAGVYNNLGESYFRLKEYDKALFAYTNAISMNGRLFNYSELACNYNNVASVYYEMKDYMRARNAYVHSLDYCKEAFGDTSSVTLMVKESIAQMDAMLKSEENKKNKKIKKNK